MEPILGFLGPLWAWVKRMFAKSPSVQIHIAPGAAYNDFRGARGEFHVHLPDGTKIQSPIPIVMREYDRAADENVTIEEANETKLIRPDGTVETRRSSGDD